MSQSAFKNQIRAGLPEELPSKLVLDPEVSHAPKRKEILSRDEFKLAIRNALRYFPKEWHAELAQGI